MNTRQDNISCAILVRLPEHSSVVVVNDKNGRENLQYPRPLFIIQAQGLLTYEHASVHKISRSPYIISVQNPQKIEQNIGRS